MTFQFLVIDSFLLGLLVNLSKVVIDILDPFSGAGFSFSDDLLLISRKSSLGGNSVSSSLGILLIGLSGGFSGGLGGRVEGVKGLLVSEGVLLLDLVGGSRNLLVSDGALDLVGVDHSRQVGVGHLVVGQMEVA